MDTTSTNNMPILCPDCDLQLLGGYQRAVGFETSVFLCFVFLETWLILVVIYCLDFHILSKFHTLRSSCSLMNGGNNQHRLLSIGLQLMGKTLLLGITM